MPLCLSVRKVKYLLTKIVNSEKISIINVKHCTKFKIVQNTMERKKLSRTVLKRLKKKARLQATAAGSSIEIDSTYVQVHPAISSKEQIKQSSSNETDSTYVQVHPATSSKELLKQKKVVHAIQPKPVKTTKIQRPKRNPENKVIYINSNYGGNEPDSLGARIQAELVGLRNESKNIKTASDLTESQAHVVKRQITRLQSTAKGKVYKRPKNVNNSLSDATKELALMIEKEQQKLVNKTAKTKT